MYLHEEYIRRHNLKIPVIYHNNRSTVFLKGSGLPVNWKILAFEWTVVTKHPSYYRLILSEPIHNGYQFDDIIRSCPAFPKKCFWDDYESQIKSVCAQLKEEGFRAITGKEKSLAAWEIFLYVHDSILAKTMDKQFFWLVEQSINTDLSLSVRSNACRTAKKMLLDKNLKISDVLIYQIMPLVRDDSDWLARFVNE